MARLRPQLHVHEVSGFAFETAEPVFDLPPSVLPPSARFSIVPHPLARQGTEWHHRSALADGRAWPAFGRCAAGYVIEFEGVCAFVISRDGRRVDASPHAPGNLAAIARLFLDQVIPLLLHLAGRECLHAGAVVVNGGACAFLGDSGAGKSTLAAHFALSGYALLSDDCLALADQPPDGIFALPGNRGSKLWPDSAGALAAPGTHLAAVAGHEAKRWLASAVAEQPVPLRAIYLLAPTAPGTPIVVEEAGAQQTVAALLEAAFRIDLRDQALLARQFRFLVRVAGAVAVRRLTYPREFAALAQVRDRILEELAT